MEVVLNILIGLYVIVCIILIALCLIQSKEDGGASETIMGASANNFYEKNKGKTREGKMKKATIILGIIFVILTVAIGILQSI